MTTAASHREQEAPVDASPQLRRVVGVLRQALGADLLAVYEYGSARVGGLRPRSDLDLFVVASRPIAGGDRLGLIRALLPISGWAAVDPDDRPLDLSVVVRDDVVPWRWPPRCELQYGEWLRGGFEAGEVAPAAPAPDLAIQLATLAGGCRRIVGPPWTELLAPVPAADLQRAVGDALPALLADLRGDERNVMLTLARMWVTRATGRIVTKDVAADWVLARVDATAAPALACARAAYLDPRSAVEDWTALGASVEAYVQAAAAAIRSDAVRAQVP